MVDLITHVVVVEDDVDSRMLLTALLTAIGYTVTSAASGDEGLRLINSKVGCDAIVADVMMPNMSGVEFARLARKLRAGLAIVLVTGQPDGIDVAVKAGTIPLLKPFTSEQLETALADATHRVRAQLPLCGA